MPQPSALGALKQRPYRPRPVPEPQDLWDVDALLADTKDFIGDMPEGTGTPDRQRELNTLLADMDAAEASSDAVMAENRARPKIGAFGAVADSTGKTIRTMASFGGPATSFIGEGFAQPLEALAYLDGKPLPAGGSFAKDVTKAVGKAGTAAAFGRLNTINGSLAALGARPFKSLAAKVLGGVTGGVAEGVGTNVVQGGLTRAFDEGSVGAAFDPEAAKMDAGLGALIGGPVGGVLGAMPALAARKAAQVQATYTTPNRMPHPEAQGPTSAWPKQQDEAPWQQSSEEAWQRNQANPGNVRGPAPRQRVPPPGLTGYGNTPPVGPNVQRLLPAPESIQLGPQAPEVGTQAVTPPQQGSPRYDVLEPGNQYQGPANPTGMPPGVPEPTLFDQAPTAEEIQMLAQAQGPQPLPAEGPALPRGRFAADSPVAAAAEPFVPPQRTFPAIDEAKRVAMLETPPSAEELQQFAIREMGDPSADVSMQPPPGVRQPFDITPKRGQGGPRTAMGAVTRARAEGDQVFVTFKDIPNEIPMSREEFNRNFPDIAKGAPADLPGEGPGSLRVTPKPGRVPPGAPVPAAAAGPNEADLVALRNERALADVDEYDPFVEGDMARLLADDAPPMPMRDPLLDADGLAEGRVPSDAEMADLSPEDAAGLTPGEVRVDGRMVGRDALEPTEDEIEALLRQADEQDALEANTGAKSLRDEPEIEVVDPDAETTLANGSGDSSASIEAIRRQAAMKAKGESFVMLDRAGRETPLIGTDAVDQAAPKGFTKAKKMADGSYQILEANGGKVPTAKAAAPEVKAAPERDAIEEVLDIGPQKDPATALREVLADVDEDVTFNMRSERLEGRGDTPAAERERLAYFRLQAMGYDMQDPGVKAALRSVLAESPAGSSFAPKPGPTDFNARMASVKTQVDAAVKEFGKDRAALVRALRERFPDEGDETFIEDALAGHYGDDTAEAITDQLVTSAKGRDVGASATATPTPKTERVSDLKAGDEFEYGGRPAELVRWELGHENGEYAQIRYLDDEGGGDTVSGKDSIRRLDDADGDEGDYDDGDYDDEDGPSQEVVDAMFGKRTGVPDAEPRGADAGPTLGDGDQAGTINQAGKFVPITDDSWRTLEPPKNKSVIIRKADGSIVTVKANGGKVPKTWVPEKWKTKQDAAAARTAAREAKEAERAAAKAAKAAKAAPTAAEPAPTAAVADEYVPPQTLDSMADDAGPQPVAEPERPAHKPGAVTDFVDPKKGPGVNVAFPERPDEAIRKAIHAYGFDYNAGTRSWKIHIPKGSSADEIKAAVAAIERGEDPGVGPWADKTPVNAPEGWPASAVKNMQDRNLTPEQREALRGKGWTQRVENRRRQWFAPESPPAAVEATPAPSSAPEVPPANPPQAEAPSVPSASAADASPTPAPTAASSRSSGRFASTDYDAAKAAAVEQARRLNMDIAVRKMKNGLTGKQEFVVSPASKNDSDYAKYEIVRPGDPLSQPAGDGAAPKAAPTKFPRERVEEWISASGRDGKMLAPTQMKEILAVAEKATGTTVGQPMFARLMDNMPPLSSLQSKAQLNAAIRKAAKAAVNEPAAPAAKGIDRPMKDGSGWHKGYNLTERPDGSIVVKQGSFSAIAKDLATAKNDIDIIYAPGDDVERRLKSQRKAIVDAPGGLYDTKAVEAAAKDPALEDEADGVLDAMKKLLKDERGSIDVKDIGEGLAGLEKLARANKRLFLTALRAGGGAFIGALTHDDEDASILDNLLIGAVAGAASPRFAGASWRALKKYPTAYKYVKEVVTGHSDDFNPKAAPVARAVPDAAKDISGRAMILWSPDKVVPDVWRHVRPIMQSLYELDAPAKNLTETQIQVARKTQIDEALGYMREMTTKATNDGHTNRAAYIKALMEDLVSAPTIPEKYLSLLTNGKVTPKQTRTVLAGVSNGIYHSLLGWNIGSGLANATQVTFNYPVLGAKATVKGILKAYSKEGRQELAFLNLNRKPLGMEREKHFNKWMESYLEASQIPMRWSDSGNRRATYAGALEYAKQRMDMNEAQAKDFANELIGVTQGIAGDLGSNPFHRQLGPLRVFTKYPLIWASMVQDFATHPDPRVKRRFFGMMTGIFAATALTGVQLTNYFIPRMGMVPGGATMADVVTHLADSADHDFEEHFEPGGTEDVIAPGFLNKLKNTGDRFNSHGLNNRNIIGRKGQVLRKVSAAEDFGSLLGIETSNRAAARKEESAMYDLADTTKREESIRSRRIRRQAGVLLERGDKAGASKALQALSARQQRDFKKERARTARERTRRMVPLRRRDEFDDRFPEKDR